MIFERIDVVCFRNLKNQTVLTSDEWISVTGSNAQGKSNFLEAVSILANGRDYRAGYSHAVPDGEKYWSLKGRLKGEERIAAYQDSSLSLTINGDHARSVDFLSKGGAVYVDDNLFWRWFAFPDERRKFIDRVLFLKDRSYLKTYQTFSHCLQQRNAALRRGSSSELLHAITDSYIDFCFQVNKKRALLVQELESCMREKLTGQDQEIKLYYPTYGRDGYFRLAERFREREKERGFSQFGPQREDVTLFINSKPAIRTLSLGQRKRKFLTMVLSAAEIAGESLLVVDDFDTDLDGKNMKFIHQIYARSPVQKFTAALHSCGESGLSYIVSEGKLSPAEETQ